MDSNLLTHLELIVGILMMSGGLMEAACRIIRLLP